MVKNIGGKNTKKGGRKFLKEEVRKIRYKKVDGETYGRVIKLLGNGICEVICNDGKIRQCIIRNKFRGRNKRSNTIMENTKVLVGLRDWEVLKEGKKERCDLLYVYNSKEEKDLKSDCNWRIIGGIDESEEKEENYELVEEEEVEDVCRSGEEIFNFEDVEIDDI